MSVLGPDGRPIDPRAHARTATHVVDGFPAWLDGVRYRADDDVITMRVAVPQSQQALAHLLALEMTPDSCRALVEALGKCLTQSARTMTVLDVPFDQVR